MLENKNCTTDTETPQQLEKYRENYFTAVAIVTKTINMADILVFNAPYSKKRLVTATFDFMNCVLPEQYSKV
jgi:hypothetical protein